MNIKLQKNIIRVFDSSIKVGWALKTMLILSIAYAMIMFLWNLGVVLLKPHIVDWIQNKSFPTSLYFYKENLLFFFSANRVMYVFNVCAFVLILNGCHLMFKGLKWGLLYYTIGKILQIIIPILFLGYRMLAIGDIMIVILFLVFYYVYAFTHKIDKKDRDFNKIQQQ